MSTSSTLHKLSTRIHEGIYSKGYIEKTDIEKFIKLSQQESKIVIKELIDIEQDSEIKERLCYIYERYSPKYEARLELMAIWASFNTGIKKSFDSKNII